MRGEFIRGDGLVIPNNITNYGARTILAAAVRNEVPTFYVGLVDAQPDPDLLISKVVEPAFVNGYARLPITRDNLGWPVEGTLNGETFFESEWLTWTASGVPADPVDPLQDLKFPFSKAIRRLMLVQHATNVVDDLSDANLKVLALSTSLPNALTINTDTVEAARKFKYRLYAR
jgi:hypothetical protein